MKSLNIFFCNFNSKLSFLINFVILYSKFFTVSELILIDFGAASGKPPLLEIITAHPQLEASKAVLPKGSSFFGQTTAILDLVNHLVTEE